MALQALQSSGVAFRKILSHFPEELSLAFAYGSGVYRQAGPSSDQKVSPGGPFAFGPSRALELPGRSAHPRINSQSPDTNPTKGLFAERQRELRFQRHVGVRLGLRAGDAVMWREELVPGQDGKKKKTKQNLARSLFSVLEFSGKLKKKKLIIWVPVAEIQI